METLIVQPKNRKQLSAIRALLKALDVSFKEAKEDETAYLSRSEDNKQALNKSIKQAESGQTVKVDVFC
ncbi:DUF2683 family protein [Pedobacter endophyticus]|uniref:Uncharacterized protein n=1 Tax=Pedobacter endophyticus TaxID=2789740 RepID=A0A7S9KZ11_9SPHI|nr:DUF2683 family protein [Pedobacter endophyticus]QPH39464.1 hypothetical protein IZT61_20880 [Pedobacter endophyticus]